MPAEDKKILIFGVNGMLGATLSRCMTDLSKYSIIGTLREQSAFFPKYFDNKRDSIRSGVDAFNFKFVADLLDELCPDLVINCIGVIKQRAAAQDPLPCIEINALFPHRLARACEKVGARLVQISTDCVFSGKGGMYREGDFPDCDDLYGRTKLLGELDYPHAVTLRTSIIGHEINSRASLLEWFLAQEGRVQGYLNAVYSGFPTVEMARIIADFVLPNPGLSGLYHVSSEPISKYDLLRLVARQYGKRIEIEPCAEFHCDRSLDSERFRRATGYEPPPWPELVKKMYDDAVASGFWKEIR